ncbi:hypothetical protein B0H10DRAFT_2238242 [Mycena sp. CBHHK59/15]|nr:hypothetical protein B0H10DRAFT_2238242 [Mycena sp. CBHHK59/15]
MRQESSFNDRGYFQHRRRKFEDEFIVPHIPWLILKYDCHINVEYSMGVNLFQYLFKYFFKGFDETNWSVRKTPKEAPGPKAPHPPVNL